jgi:hypothetical protein
MRIEADLKLGFKDVLIRPKRSTLSSRAQVKLERIPFGFATVAKVGPASQSWPPIWIPLALSPWRGASAPWFVYGGA